MDRVKCKPWGLFDGHSGEGNSVAISRGGSEKETHFPNGKALNQVLKSGDAYILRSGGGGGYGSPLERNLDSLAHDVRCGYVTREQAESKYGAVFAPDGTIDAKATVANRADMRAKDLPVDEPIAPTPIFPEHFEAARQPVRNDMPDKLTDEERMVFAMNKTRQVPMAPMMDGARRGESLINFQRLIQGEQSSCCTRRRTFLEGHFAG